MDRRQTLARAAPAGRRRLFLLLLQQQTLVRGWRSHLLLLEGEDFLRFPALLGAARTSGLLLLCLSFQDFSSLRLCSRELQRVFTELVDLLRVQARRLQRAYIA